MPTMTIGDNSASPSDAGSAALSRERAKQLRQIGSVLRDAWLMFGITLLIFLVVEYCYRAQGMVRRRLGQSDTPTSHVIHPQAKEPWYRDWVKQGPGAHPQFRYHPHLVYWPEEYAVKYIRVDATGLRVTPQSPVAEPKRTLFVLGGSTMWGYTVRDSFTIPAIVARELRTRGIHDVEVLNLAQRSYTETQSVIQLVLELRRGNVPDIVVSLTGHNDIAAAYASGEAGQVLNEARARQRWEDGGRGFRSGMAIIARTSQLVTRLNLLVGRGAERQVHRQSMTRVCGDVASHFRQLMLTTEALGRQFGFTAIAFWQPMIGSVKKPLSPWEQRLEKEPGLDEMVGTCSRMVDSLMNDRRARTYHPLHDVFGSDTSTVFVDSFSHLTEPANERVAARITDVIAPLLVHQPKFSDTAAARERVRLR